MSDAWQRLEDLPEGSLFVTQDGIMAVKSEYRYSNYGQCMCVLLASGEYAHFARGNDTLCRVVDVPAPIPPDVRETLRGALQLSAGLLMGDILPYRNKWKLSDIDAALSWLDAQGGTP